MTGKFLLGTAVALLPFSLSAVAQSVESTVECPRPEMPTGEFESWSSSVTLVAASDLRRLDYARLSVGQTVDLALVPIDALRPPAPPRRASGNGGMATIVIAEPGTYRVALGTGAWVDVVAAGKAIASTAHGHGPSCTGIRKVVDFQLEPGRYTIVISGNPELRTRLLVVRRP